MTTLTGLHANLKAGRYDYTKTWPKRRRAAFLAHMKARRIKPAFLTVTECEYPHLQSLAQDLGMKNWGYRGSGILWDPAQLSMTDVLREVPWLAAPQTQSLLALEFAPIAFGYEGRFNVLASHLPPFVTRAALRRGQMGVIDTIVNRWEDPTILCTDANWSKTCEAFMQARGWASARTTATTKIKADYATSGTRFKRGNPIDYAFLANGAKAALYAVRDGRTWSDHNMIELAVTL